MSGDIIGAQAPERQDVLEQLGTLGVERPFLCRFGDDRVELVERRHVGELLDRLDASEAQHPVRCSVEEPDRRAEDAQEQRHRLRHRSGHALGSGDGQVLRYELGDHHLPHRHEEKAGDHRNHVLASLRDPQPVEHRFEDGVRDRFGDETHQQRGRGDAELCAREHEAEPPQNREGAAGAALTGLGRGLQGVPVDSHEGELGGDEEPVADDEDDDRRDPGDHSHRATPLSVAITASVSAA